MCYVFLRMHHVIFSRLATARQLAHIEAENATAEHPLTLVDDDEDEEDPAAVKKTGSSSSSSSSSYRRSSLKNINRYSSFLGLLYGLLDGTLDSPRYGIDCAAGCVPHWRYSFICKALQYFQLLYFCFASQTCSRYFWGVNFLTIVVIVWQVRRGLPPAAGQQGLRLVHARQSNSPGH